MTDGGDRARARGVDEVAPTGPPRGQRAIAWASLALLALLAGACLASAYAFGSRILGLAEPRPAAPAATVVVRPTADVVVAVRDLARLETAQYHMERVIDLEERQRRVFGLLEAKDAILLVAAGDVRAGVDLARLREQDVTVDAENGHATLVLPAPEVLSARLDEQRTYVHTRATDTLAKRSDSLESRARREAEATIQAAAVEAGLLDRARENARVTVRALVRSLGFERVDVRFVDEE